MRGSPPLCPAGLQEDPAPRAAVEFLVIYELQCDKSHPADAYLTTGKVILKRMKHLKKHRMRDGCFVNLSAAARLSRLPLAKPCA